MRLIYYYLVELKGSSISEIIINKAIINPGLNCFPCFNLLQWSPDHLPSIYWLFPWRRRPLCNWLFSHGGWRHLLFPRRLPLPIYSVVGYVPAGDSAPCVWPGFLAAEGPGRVATKIWANYIWKLHLVSAILQWSFRRMVMHEDTHFPHHSNHYWYSNWNF